MNISLLRFVLAFYFLSGIAMIAIGELAIDNLPLVIAGSIIVIFSIIVLLAINIKAYMDTK